MRVLFIVPHPIEGPSSRFRVYQFIQYLEAHGVQATVRPFVSSRHALALYKSGGLFKKITLTLLATLGRVVDIFRATRFDVVYILREAFPFGPPFFEAALALAGTRLIYDFDDAIWQRFEVYDNPLDRLRDWDKPAKVIRRARHVVVGSQYLADFARQYASNPAAVSIVPTVVDSTIYSPRPTLSTDEKITIGWIGTPRGSDIFLKKLLPTMQDFATRFPHVCWRFVGAEPFEVGKLPVEFKTWQLAEEVSDIQSFNIGLMPLTDDKFTRGKCGFKLIQYMNCGIPAVCSPVGANCEIIEEGVNGFFAETDQQWSDALERLILDRRLRQSMGEQGRNIAEQHYSLHAQSPRLLEILQGVTQGAATLTNHPPSTGKTIL